MSNASKVLILGVLGLLVAVPMAHAAEPASGQAAATQTETGPLGQADFNHDGKVSLQEHLGWEKMIFVSNDFNGDGYISTDEMAQKQLEAFTVLMQNKGRGESDVSQMLGDLSTRRIVFGQELDPDGDGRVSEAEHLRYEEANFHRNDLDGDGFITRDELERRRHEIAARMLRKMEVMRSAKESTALNGRASTNYQETE